MAKYYEVVIFTAAMQDVSFENEINPFSMLIGY